MIEITGTLRIPEGELSFTASRSSGAGGQHVNKVNTRVILRFDVGRSSSLSEGQKRRIRQRLHTRITREGVVWVACGRHRSQAANRREATERFALLIRDALRRRTPRRKTTPSAGVRRRRLEQKQRRGELKRTRARVRAED